MKRILLFAFLTLSLHAFVNAQTPDPYTPIQQPHPQKDSATRRAVRQLKILEKRLHLNEDQVLQLQVILINRDVAMDSVARRHSIGPAAPPDSGRASDFRRTDNRARRSIQQSADQKINAILSDDQKTLYQQWKEEQRQRMELRRQMNRGSDSTRVNN
ncbi:MAG TPA: hypothetical protein VGS79_23795 [Puia sp.]|nr:hypothetical protein [Puia sp.]